MSTRLFLLFVTREVGKSSKRQERRTPKLGGQRPGSRQTPGFLPALPAPRQEPPLATPLPAQGFSGISRGDPRREPPQPAPQRAFPGLGGGRGLGRLWLAAPLQHQGQLRPARPDGAAAPAARCPPELERPLRRPGDALRGARGARPGRGKDVPGGRGEGGGDGEDLGRGQPGVGRRCEARRARPGTMTRREGAVREGGLG